ncbi:hypothetical protein IJI94_01340 [Candidatus Saccharibacteria bacterium]|nr:hypothetical protein [Candidatus Saccharibacteria bacterium]
MNKRKLELLDRLEYVIVFNMGIAICAGLIIPEVADHPIISIFVKIVCLISAIVCLTSYVYVDKVTQEFASFTVENNVLTEIRKRTKEGEEE